MYVEQLLFEPLDLCKAHLVKLLTAKNANWINPIYCLKLIDAKCIKETRTNHTGK